jgi:hypothetical protein
MTNEINSQLEQFNDSIGKQITPGFYRDIRGGIYHVFEKSGYLCLTESCDPTDHVYRMAWHLAIFIRRIEFPNHEIESLLESALFLERKLKEINH